MGSQRSVSIPLKYDGEIQVDSGRAIERLHMMHDSCGRSIYLQADTSADLRLTTKGRFYDLDVTFIDFTPDGLLLAKISETVKNTKSVEKYEGNIKQSDLRIMELKKTLANGDAPPSSLRLRYQGIHNYIYLVFYDLEGHLIYYRFRDTRWDPMSSEIKRLIEGRAYEVNGSPFAVILKDVIVNSDENAYFPTMADQNSIPVFQFNSAIPLFIDQILF